MWPKNRSGGRQGTGEHRLLLAHGGVTSADQGDGQERESAGLGHFVAGGHDVAGGGAVETGVRVGTEVVRQCVDRMVPVDAITRVEIAPHRCNVRDNARQVEETVAGELQTVDVVSHARVRRTCGPGPELPAAAGAAEDVGRGEGFAHLDDVVGDFFSRHRQGVVVDPLAG